MLSEIKERIANEEHEMAEVRPHGINHPGFNQPLGARDALQWLLEWIEEEEGEANDSNLPLLTVVAFESLYEPVEGE